MNKTSTYHLIDTYRQISNEKDRPLWARAAKLLQSANIRPSAEVKDLNLKRIKAKPKECYMNALAVCLENPHIEYVEGFIEVHGVPIEHAWNCLNGKHFDLTSEALGQLDCPHQSIMVIPGNSVIKFAAKSLVSGPYLLDWLKNQIPIKK